MATPMSDPNTLAAVNAVAYDQIEQAVEATLELRREHVMFTREDFDLWGDVPPAKIADAVAEVITAAAEVEVALMTPAVREGVKILDRLDPDVYRALMAAITSEAG